MLPSVVLHFSSTDLLFRSRRPRAKVHCVVSLPHSPRSRSASNSPVHTRPASSIHHPWACSAIPEALSPAHARDRLESVEHEALAPSTRSHCMCYGQQAYLAIRKLADTNNFDECLPVCSGRPRVRFCSSVTGISDDDTATTVAGAARIDVYPSSSMILLFLGENVIPPRARMPWLRGCLQPHRASSCSVGTSLVERRYARPGPQWE